MTDFKYADGALVYFDNDYGMPTDGQVVDRWADEYGAWYVVIDCGTPEGREVELHEDSLRGVTP